MNILLVYPSSLDKNNKPIKYKKAFLPPLSLAILDSLTLDQYSVNVVNDIVENIDFSGSYDLVGITAMTTQIKRAYQIADAFRKRGIKVIMGGMHPTILPEEVKEHANSVVIGEADNLWKQIIDDCKNNNLKEFYQDTAFPDLKKLLIPKWDNMNMRIYPRRFGAKFPMMPIFTTRGCPFNCKFCAVTRFFGRSYRAKPISNVIQEIDRIGAKEYFFVDDNIAGDIDYSRELFHSLSRKNIRWFSQVSTTVVKAPDLIDLAGKAGCSGLFIGVESLNKASLKAVNKVFNKVEQYEELIARMHRAGIDPFLSFIFGFDEDTPDQFRRTLEFLKKNSVGSASFWILTPFPGTELFAEMKNEARIEEYNWSMFDGTNIVFQPKNFSKQQLYELYWKSYQKLYSVKNIVVSIWHNITISKKPLHTFFENLFYKTYFRKKVYSYDHPFSGGFDRVR